MSGDADDPARQLAAAWGAAAAVLKLDPAVRAAMEAGRAALAGDWRDCRCQCREAHPDDVGVCDRTAVMTRQLGHADVPLCAPCAVAQGVAELPR
jgi:hypothetical protein